MLYLKEILLIPILCVIVTANVYDLTVDYSQGVSDWHLYEESLVVLLSSLSIGYLALSLRRQHLELQQLRRDVEASREHKQATDRHLTETRERMGRVIQQQFENWELTGSEREVALLLLKGLSFKEIAAIRNTLEKTVRQQASSIYKKANVTGRASFSAWFIEDIL